MRLRQIQDFLAVVEEGCIHAAARKTGLSQPAVTKSLRTLEAELHTQLVRRTPQGVVATPSGRAFYTRARAAQSELRKAEEEIAHLGGVAGGSVAFGVGPVAAILVAPEAVLRFNRQYPSATSHIIEGHLSLLIPMVRDGTLDFAMVPRLQTKLDPALAFRPLFRENFVIVGRKNHPLQNTGTVARMSAATWVSGLGEGGVAAGPLSRLFLAAELPQPRVIVHSKSYNTAVAVMAQSDILGVMAHRYLSTAPARDLLQEIVISEPISTFTIGLFMRKDPPLTSVATALVKEMAAAAKQLAARLP